MIFFSPRQKGNKFPSTKSKCESLLPRDKQPSETARNASSSSTFGSLQLHSDMESCAGHLQNRTCSRSKAGRRGRRVVIQQAGLAAALRVARDERVMCCRGCPVGAGEVWRAEGKGSAALPTLAQTSCATGPGHQVSIWPRTQVAPGKPNPNESAYLLPLLDSPAGANDNLVSSLESYHLSHAVGCTRMVDVPTKQGLEKVTFEENTSLEANLNQTVGWP